MADQPFSLQPLLPGWSGNPVGRGLLGMVERLSGLSLLQDAYDRLPSFGDARGFLENAFDTLGIRYHAPEQQVARIPRTGPVIVVANHPFGAVDGMIMAHLLTGIRDDVRVMANYHLGRIPPLRELFFIVDPFDGTAAHSTNRKPLRDSIRWLQRGGLLMVFPAGEVSHYQFRQRRITDPAWSDTIGRLVRRSEASVVPVCFHGRNSAMFNLAGFCHARLRTLLLPRELVRKADSEIRLTIGKPIDNRKLDCLATPHELTAYLRLRCYLLETGEPLGRRASAGLRRTLQPDAPAEPLRSPVPQPDLVREIEQLPMECLLHEAGPHGVYVARAEQIPWLLQEIGRLREEAFRSAGEGTGKAADIDLFDTWYRHLFIWHRERAELVGAYRLGPVEEILASRGKRGLYSRTLFRYRKSLLTSFGPSMELGRSFVRPDYQRSFQALNLLWKGIGLYAARENIAVLFGPVSISRDYSESSRQIIANCLQQAPYRSQLARRVRPSRPMPGKAGRRSAVKLIPLPDVDLVSDIVSQLEADDKGLPVLLRQYLRLGGRFLGFSLDPDFADVLDGLVVVDLRDCEPRVLERYMGAGTTERFLRHFAVGAA